MAVVAYCGEETLDNVLAAYKPKPKDVLREGLVCIAPCLARAYEGGGAGACSITYSLTHSLTHILYGRGGVSEVLAHIAEVNKQD